MEWGFSRGMTLLVLLVLVVLWAVVALAVRVLLAPLRSHQVSPERDPVEEVEHRYAAGEIDRDELLRRRRELREHRA